MAKKLGTLVKEARSAAGLSQTALAAKVDGLSAADVGKVERGEKIPAQAVIKEMAKALGVTQTSLLNASDAMPQTIVINAQGIVTYNAQTPLTYDKLKELYLAARADQSGAEEKEALLPALSSASDSAAALKPAAETAEKANQGVYSVTVTDQNGQPVSGVTLAFCTALACRNAEPSDENGLVFMTLKPDKYHIQVIDMPDGFDGPGNTDLYLGPDSQNAVLIITRK